MTPKANLVLAIIAGSLLAALLSHERAFALLAVPFLFYLVGGLVTFGSPGTVEVSRTPGNARGHETDVIAMKVRVTNPGTRQLALRLDESLQPGMTLLVGRLSRRVSLPAGESLDYRYTFNAKRGHYHWERFRAVQCDLFGLFERVIETPAAAELDILPDGMLLRRVKFRPQNTLHTPGLNLSHQPGTGTDFWGVREYHSGDSIRWIDWQHSARQPNTIITKEFEREEIADIGLLLDARQVTNCVPGMEALFEYSVRATLSLAEVFIKTGNRVSLMVLGKTLIRVFPGSGRGQLARIQEKLAGCELSENPRMDSLRYLPVKLFPSRAMVVLVSPLSSQDAEAIRRLHRNGYQVIVVSPNPVGSTTPGKDGEAALLATRTARLERSVLLWKLRQMGVEVIDWSTQEPLQVALQANAALQRNAGRVN
jgi:uncharacterized protein (DUF58 family)